MHDTGIFNELIITIIRGLLIPLVPVVTSYLIALIKKMTEDINNQLNNVDFLKYADIAENIINTAVIAVYQTYINNILKQKIALTDDEMKIAFNMIKEKSVKIISDITISELEKKYTNLDKWLENKIICCANQEKVDRIKLADKIGMEVML
ncbi:hypothetical protein [Geosporobacter ferrireducens]|uniref:Uncharacterized protein n=1 Tax=Geosporobacter ferrireducens TaxID=1424294 RepID=A0A1D8GEJ6_9FIRM|nr:hypothetical protein [Geosporobacter ferrireducens]AOT69317.1 hypothetical protein Gferi_06875 [Geosporobacter ferrireducens]MTI57003.1 hypothetical protein [Geosporobacter ferrireducens]